MTTKTSRIWTTIASLNFKKMKFTMSKRSQLTSLISTPRTINPQRLESHITKMDFKSKLITHSECDHSLPRLAPNNSLNTKLGSKTLTSLLMTNSSPEAAKYLNNNSNTFSSSRLAWPKSTWLEAEDALELLGESLKLVSSQSLIRKFTWAPTLVNNLLLLSLRNLLQSSKKSSNWDPESYSKNVNVCMTTWWKAEWQPTTWKKRT